MSAETEQRAYEIVEELRADIDFELDDVITRIVRGLPRGLFHQSFAARSIDTAQSFVGDGHLQS